VAVRLVITIQAKPGRGSELLAEMEPRCAAARAEPGCEQFEIFQSGRDPDTLCLLELWSDQAALDAHAARGASAPPSPRMAELRADGPPAREDYAYNRTR